MIEDAFPPGETKAGFFAAREDGRVFDGDAALVVITIERPRLKLAARKLAFMHKQMKRMLVVVTLFTNGVKAGDELGLREQRFFGRGLNR